jgi:hypothetical protein
MDSSIEAALILGFSWSLRHVKSVCRASGLRRIGEPNHPGVSSKSQPLMAIIESETVWYPETEAFLRRDQPTRRAMIFLATSNSASALRSITVSDESTAAREEIGLIVNRYQRAGLC